ncbi:MAG: SpoIIE family protein phosphatase [Oscillospiraceae bacterium]|nr:SpoIIE family protein phosphatase [Oscillospiraceae bacterium]
MMRKRTNRCSNTVWDISVISRNKDGETLCGDQCTLEWADDDATVILSDGLGSGVKANILSTLTSTMLTTMLKGDVPIEECVTTVAETLPMCKERKLAYATFTILQTNGSRVRLIQYDNPSAVFVHDGAIAKYNYSVNFIQEKELHESHLHFDVGDMLVLFSDGVSEAGRGVTTDAGWARQDIEDFILRNYTPNVSAQRVAASILSTVKTLDLDAMHDDTTIVVARLRERCPVNIMIGPPESKDDDLSTIRLFFGKEGKHIVCGGTTAKAVAEYLGVKVRTLPGSGTEEVPPMSEIHGVDLATEGVVTINATMERIKAYLADGMYTLELARMKDGASRLALILLEEATEINVLFGNAINLAQQDGDFGFERKLQLVQELRDMLTMAGKTVKMSIC